jgi:hypothetical protein
MPKKRSSFSSGGVSVLDCPVLERIWQKKRGIFLGGPPVIWKIAKFVKLFLKNFFLGE